MFLRSIAAQSAYSGKTNTMSSTNCQSTNTQSDNSSSSPIQIEDHSAGIPQSHTTNPIAILNSAFQRTQKSDHTPTRAKPKTTTSNLSDIMSLPASPTINPAAHPHYDAAMAWHLSMNHARIETLQVIANSRQFPSLTLEVSNEFEKLTCSSCHTDN